MLDVIAILGLAVTLVTLMWVAIIGYRHRFSYLWCKCCRTCAQLPPQDHVVIQVDLSSGAVRTYHDNSLVSAFSQSTLQVTQVSALSQPAAQDSKVKPVTPVTPATPARMHASHASISTQTTSMPSSPDSCTTTASEYLTEVTPLNKSMWVTLSPDTTTLADDSANLMDTLGGLYINTTYFEEPTEANSQGNHSSLPLDSGEASETMDLIELYRLNSSSSSCHGNSVSPDDPSLAQSTTTLLAESESGIFSASLSLAMETQTHPDHLSCISLISGVEGECHAPESDRDSYYTCDDDASEGEEKETPLIVMEMTDLSVNARQHYNPFENDSSFVVIQM